MGDSSPVFTLRWINSRVPSVAAAFTHQFVRDPSDLRDLVGAERESYLSEVVIHIVVVVQLYDQDQLPAGRHGGGGKSVDNK